MRLIKQIKIHDIGSEIPPDLREASRAVLRDKQGKVPLLYVSKYRFHKLPGGGIEVDEDKIVSLERECKEEIGAEIEILGEIGCIHEYRKQTNLKQISYCFYGTVLKKGKPSFTKKELSEGFGIVWLDYDDALKSMKADKPKNYQGRFIRERDFAFLKAAKDLLK
jgi:8-oxo-dGTP pyrophosphatase MutT (NUDIX family)